MNFAIIASLRKRRQTNQHTNRIGCFHHCNVDAKMARFSSLQHGRDVLMKKFSGMMKNGTRNGQGLQRGNMDATMHDSVKIVGSSALQHGHERHPPDNVVRAPSGTPGTRMRVSWGYTKHTTLKTWKHSTSYSNNAPSSLPLEQYSSAAENTPCSCTKKKSSPFPKNVCSAAMPALATKYFMEHWSVLFASF